MRRIIQNPCGRTVSKAKCRNFNAGFRDPMQKAKGPNIKYTGN